MPQERGAASILISLSNSQITVYHGTAGDVLREPVKVEPGAWTALWKAIDAVLEEYNRETT
jgi:hypothetical protein